MPKPTGDREPNAIGEKEPEWWTLTERRIIGPDILEAAQSEIRDLIDLLDVRPDGLKLLDMPCGVGRHAIELARKGFIVTGVDYSADFLESAREGAEQAGLEIEYHRDDMRDFRRRAAYDVAISLWDSFGYFSDPADDLLVLRNYFDSLKRGGVFVMEVTPKEAWAMSLADEDGSINLYGDWESMESEEAEISVQSEVSDDWSWLTSRWRAAQGGEVFEDEGGRRIYSARELKHHLLQTGFGDVQTYGSLAGIPFDHESVYHTKTLVVVARKP